MVGCRSRRSWTVGSIQRPRSWEVTVARRPCPPRPDVRLSPRQYWRCYFNVQRYLSPEVSVHSFSSGSRSAESFEQLTLVQKLVHERSPVTNSNLAGHSAIVKRKKEEINMNKYEQRFSLLGVVEHASGQQLRSRHCSSQQSRKNPKELECVISKELAMSRPLDDGTNNAQSTCWWSG